MGEVVVSVLPKKNTPSPALTPRNKLTLVLLLPSEIAIA
jgi:hypothetical protein